MPMEWHWAQVMEILGSSWRTRYKNIIQDILLMCYWDLYMNIGYRTKNKGLFCSLYPIASKTRRNKKRGTKEKSEKIENREKKKKKERLNTSYMTICPSFCYEEKKLRWLVSEKGVRVLPSF